MINPKKLPPPLLAVRAFIQDDGKILILNRAPGDAYGNLWCLPGGKVDFGQTAEEAIVREVLEETSLECTSAQFLFYMDGLPEEPADKHYLTLFFECKVKGSLRLNRESSEFSWIGPEDIDIYKFAFDSDEAIQSFWSNKVSL
jgi:mutator protein MutT